MAMPRGYGEAWQEGSGSRQKMEGEVVHVSSGDGPCFPGWEERRLGWGAGEEIQDFSGWQDRIV